ncbi:hypothetical protein DH2020_016338 [Rehmannia glutinosa]|uniref:Uncharacterized protein n=1 Tax=Rehmannia glutinosa TaxID=99300 RepID=A0ABR0WMP6_REHGL
MAGFLHTTVLAEGTMRVDGLAKTELWARNRRKWDGPRSRTNRANDAMQRQVFEMGDAVGVSNHHD